MRREHAVAFSATFAPGAEPGTVVLRATADGEGQHTFSVRTDNLDLTEPAAVSVDLGRQGTRVITWHARIADKSTPWVAVVLRDGELNGHVELGGVSR
jgi:hypothetical protein